MIIYGESNISSDGFKIIFNNYRLVNERGEESVDLSSWTTHSNVSIKKKKTKGISPYPATEMREKKELLCVIRYESRKRNKAILVLLCDLDALLHEVALLKIRYIRLKEKYGEGKIPLL